jgi:hypothetical protein
MAKLTVNETKHIDKIQEALEELKKPKFRNVGEYGKFVKSQTSPSYEQKAIIMYSILDMIESRKREWGEMNNEKLVAIVSAIAKEVNLSTQELIKVLVHLLSDAAFFAKTNKSFKELFIPTRN